MARRRSRKIKARNGEGSICQRASDGRWMASFYVGDRDAGTRKRVVLYAATEQDAERKLGEALDRIDMGQPAVEATMTLGAWIESWLTGSLAASDRKETTKETYASLARTHIVPLVGHVRLDRLRPSHVETLVSQMRAAGLADSTIRQTYTVLRQALGVAVRDDLVRRNVAAVVARPKVRRVEARYLTPDEAQAFLDAARDHRLFALWSVGIACGLRKGEALALRWSDVNLDAGTLRVARTLSRTRAGLTFTEPKTQRSRRVVPMPAPTVERLREHRTAQLAERLRAGNAWTDHDLVFCTEIGTPLDGRNVLRAFKTLARRAGVDDAAVHTLRHTCASLLLAQGAQPREIMETLGHSGISIAMDIYAHVMPQRQRESADRMAGVLRW